MEVSIKEILSWAWTLGGVGIAYLIKQMNELKKGKADAAELADLKLTVKHRGDVIANHEAEMRALAVRVSGAEDRAAEDRSTFKSAMDAISRKLDRIEEKIDRKADKDA